jgi:hypothetical protein
MFAKVDGNHQPIRSWPIIRATIVGTPFCRQMLTLVFRVGGYELSGRESNGDIDAVVMPPKQEITVEEENLGHRYGSQLVHWKGSTVTPCHVTVRFSRKACRSPAPF